MTRYQGLLPLLLGVCACFSEPARAPGTTDADTDTDIGSGSGDGSSGDTAGPSGGTRGSGSQSGDASTSGSGPATTADSVDPDASATATSTESGDTGRAESSSTSGDESAGLAPYGSPCVAGDECEGGVCVIGTHAPGGMCSVSCDLDEGACPAVGRAAFCIELAVGFGCFGELDTGDELEDRLVGAGDTVTAWVGAGDSDAFYVEFLAPGLFTLLVEPQSGLDVVVTLYNHVASYQATADFQGVGGEEGVDYTVQGLIETFPNYSTVVVSAANGTSGSYQVSLVAE